MQLPRGTFREIRKGAAIADLLDELESSKFSGICSISSPVGTGTLVTKGGKIILVKYLGRSGDNGWNELMGNPAEEVDAALSSLDDAQIQLALEFNKPCRLARAGRPSGAGVKPQAAGPVAPARKPAPPLKAAAPAQPDRAPQKSPAASLFHRPAPPAEPAAPPQQAPAPKQPLSPHRPAMPAPPSVPAPPKSAAPEEELPGEAGESGSTTSSFEKDIDTFDTMDLDNVTDKIRSDVKTMIKQLHLEHLMER